MEPLAIPEAGLALRGAPDADIGAAHPRNPATQMLRLDLPDSVLDDILRAVKNGATSSKSVQVSFGRTSNLHYGNQSRELASGPETARYEVYRRSAGEPQELSFAGLVSHRVELRKPEEVTAGADAAMLALQNSMAALDKEKKSNQTLFVADNSKLPPAMSKRAAVKAKNTSGLFKVNRAQLFDHATTRSLPSSPSQGPLRSPAPPNQAQPPTSAPVSSSQNAIKIHALRTPLIHLLAVRPATEKLLARTTRCSTDVIRQVLDKVAKPAAADGEWRLSDRTYKELDAWGFRYPSQGDRQAAIDNAVSAFDRQRLSKSDPLWQRLLPTEERGKGKVLSKLHHLHQGPMLMNGNPAPTIKVQPTDDNPVAELAVDGGADASDTGDQQRTLIESQGQEMKRSSSQPVAQKKKKVSEREAMSKRLLSHSKNPKKTTKSPEKARQPKAPQGKENAKFKSAEFVHDSDEDEEMEDLFDQGSSATNPAQEEAAAAEPSPNPGPKRLEPEPEKMTPKAQGQQNATASDTPHKSSSSSSQGDSTSKMSAGQARHPPREPATRPRMNSSPQKPSPLGSSPPANVSEMESERFYHASSSSSTPSTSQHSKGASTPTPLPSHKAKETNSKPAASVKRKAEDHAAAPNKRHAPMRQPTPPATQPPGMTDDYSSSSASPPAFSQTLTMARKFKDFHGKYLKLHQELSRQSDPPAERLAHLMKMHQRLESMKTSIFRASAGM